MKEKRRESIQIWCGVDVYVWCGGCLVVVDQICELGWERRESAFPSTSDSLKKLMPKCEIMEENNNYNEG
jgi:hypothetical protein